MRKSDREPHLVLKEQDSTHGDPEIFNHAEAAWLRDVYKKAARTAECVSKAHYINFKVITVFFSMHFSASILYTSLHLSFLIEH